MINKIGVKTFYRFVEFTLKIRNIILPHERIKQIVLDEYKAESKEELLVKRLSNAYAYLLSNAKQIMSKNILKQCYNLLTNKKLNHKVIDNILNQYYQHLDESAHYLASLIHFEVINNVKERKIEYAFLLSSLIMYQKVKTTLIPYLYVKKYYKEAIKNKNIALLMCVFMDIEVKKKITKMRKVSKEKVIDKIKENKEKLINQFQVKKMYLYGSIVKKIRHESSDIDLLVIFDTNLINNERKKMKKKICKELSDLLKNKVDIIDFSHALTKMDIKEMENIITII